MFDIPFLKRLIILNGLVPLSILVWDAWRDQLGANKVNYAIHVTGIVALVFLVLSLAVTPLRAVTGWQTLVAYRRSLGLYGFFYALIHLCLYVVFDRAGNLSSTLSELASRRYLQVGLASIVLMMPLAVTSTDAMIRRLGPKRWKRLHRLAYVAIALGGLHYLLLVKSDIRQPAAFLSAIGMLLVGRFGTKYLDKSRRASPTKRNLKALPPSSTNDRPRFWKGQLKLVKIFRETPDVKTFRLVDPNGGKLPFDFQPGQYLNLKLPIDGETISRSYTIASSPTRRDYCEITIKREPNGKASRFIHDTWHEGDSIEVGAPAGKFFFTGKDVEEVVLIAGGVGITPVMSMLRYLTDRSWSGRVHFIFVAKTVADIVFQDELDYLAERFPNLQLHITLTRGSTKPDDEHRFESGRLTSERLLGWIPNLASLTVYMCGPDPMMADTRVRLMEAGILESAIHTEAFSSHAAVQSNDYLTRSSTADDSSSNHSANDGTASYLLRVANSTTAVEVEAGESILEGAERYGLEIPFECRSGVCGQCKVRLCSGKVRMDHTYALTGKEREQGWILACQAQLDTDCEIKIQPSPFETKG